MEIICTVVKVSDERTFNNKTGGTTVAREVTLKAGRDVIFASAFDETARQVSDPNRPKGQLEHAYLYMAVSETEKGTFQRATLLAIEPLLPEPKPF